MVRTALALVVWLASVAPPAAAQTAEARERAQALVRQGKERYEQGDYEAALEKFISALQIFHSARIYFNVGQAYRGLARSPEAIEAFQKFLDEAPDAEAALRDEAKQRIAESRTRVATLEVVSDVPGAEVLVDGRSYGQTPLAKPVLIAAGPHQILVQKAGYPIQHIEAIDAARGGYVRIQARLDVSPDTLAGAAPLSISTPAESPKNESSPAYTRWWFWTLIGVAAVAAAAAAVVVVTSRNELPAGSFGTLDCRAMTCQ